MPTLRILYKSGNSQDVECEKFTITKRAAALEEIVLTKAKPRPAFFGADDIEAIYVVKE